MKTLKTTLFIAVRSTVVAIVFFGIMGLPSASLALEAKTASDIVTLRGSPESACPVTGVRFTQQFPDGTDATSNFSVPAGQVFVVTSFQWFLGGGSAGTLGNVFPASVSVQTTGNDRVRVLRSIGITSGNGNAGGNVVMPTGFVAGPGTIPCLEPTTSAPFVLDGYLHGLLAPDR